MASLRPLSPRRSRRVSLAAHVVKKGTSFRVSSDTIAFIHQLAEPLGLADAALVEMLIRRIEKFDDILSNPGLTKDVARIREDAAPLPLYPVRLSEEAKRILKKSTRELRKNNPGVSQAYVLEMVVLDAARRESLV